MHRFLDENFYCRLNVLYRDYRERIPCLCMYTNQSHTDQMPNTPTICKRTNKAVGEGLEPSRSNSINSTQCLQAMWSTHTVYLSRYLQRLDGALCLPSS